jgi:hypothetical protein
MKKYNKTKNRQKKQKKQKTQKNKTTKIYGRGPVEINIPGSLEYIRKTYIFFVEGLGCDKKKDNYINNNPHYVYDNRCLKTIQNTLGNIVLASVGKIPLENSEKLNNLINTVLEKTVKYDVFLFGFSFGGLVVNRVAEELIKLYSLILFI